MAAAETQPFAPRFEAERELLDRTYEQARNLILPGDFVDYATRIAEVYRPSGTVSYTLGTEIERIITESGIDSGILDFHQDDRDTGNPRIVVNGSVDPRARRPHFILSHGDEISGVITTNGRSEAKVTPIYDHKQLGIEYPGAVLRYIETNLGEQRLEVISRGMIVTDSGGEISFTTQRGPNGQLAVGDRVVFDPDPRLQEYQEILEGQIDNTIGVAISISSALALAEIIRQNPGLYRNFSATFIFDDYEEGNPGGLFGGGAKNLAQVNLRDPKLAQSIYIVCDGHSVLSTEPKESVSDRRLKSVSGALIAATVSSGKGLILQPDSQFRLDYLIDLVRGREGLVYYDGEMGALTSRSSENGLRYGGVPDQNIRVMGFGATDFHHVDGRTARASLSSAVETARFATVMSVAASKDLL